MHATLSRSVSRRCKSSSVGPPPSSAYVPRCLARCSSSARGGARSKERSAQHAPSVRFSNTTATMGGVMAKTVHPACALVGYTIVTALVFAGLAASPFDMFVAVGVPTCMPGTTSTPYPFTFDSASGQPVPPTGPNAPNDATSPPFCSTDALFNSYNLQFYAYGYLGSVFGATNFWNAGQTIQITPYCFKKSNGTCPTFSDLGVNIIKVTTSASRSNAFQVTDGLNYLAALGNAQNGGTGGNNLPITFAAGSTLPVTSPIAMDASKTYYIRAYSSNSLSFQIAADTTSPPLSFTTTPSSTITATLPSSSSCASQLNVQPVSSTFGPLGSVIVNPASVNADGTMKTGSCGYCLTQPQQVGVLAVPGLCGTTITLLLIIELMMCAPFIRKMGFFRILVIVVSVLCMIFLIAAVASAGPTLYQVAMCQLETDLSQAQFMPSPYMVPLPNGYTPSSGGAPLYSTSGQGLFKNNQGSLGYPAAYLKPLLIPSGGAVLIIIAIVFLFLFTIVFAIKTDWTAVSSSAADSSQMMTPH